MIEKEEEYNPENHDIEVKYGENIKVYNGKMDFYYDHENFFFPISAFLYDEYTAIIISSLFSELSS